MVYLAFLTLRKVSSPCQRRLYLASARCDNVGKVVPLENFEAGQSVEIHSGPFAIFIATVEQMASDVWAWVLLDFMDKEPCGQVDRK